MKRVRLMPLSGLLLAALSGGSAPAQTWRQLLPTNAPSARGLATMVSAPGLAQIVLFGGSQIVNGNWTTPNNETWTWNGVTWSQVQAYGPCPRAGHGLAYDSLRNRVVLFGATVRNGPVCPNPPVDTWEFTGTQWINRTPTGQNPIFRGGPGMAYDAARQKVVLFGGENYPNYYNDTWLWDGTNWTQQSPPNSPPPRTSQAMVYDDVRQRVVLTCGYAVYPGNFYFCFHDTWEWDGQDWTLIPTAVAPTPRALATLTWDPNRKRAVLFGGIDQYYGSLNDTWEWDGTVWQQIATPDAPAPRWGHGMAYDATRGCAVVFGGVDPMVPANYRDTWTYPGGTLTPYGTGCGAPNLILSGRVAPEIGRQIQLQLNPQAAPLSIWEGGLLPANVQLSGFGMPGCFHYVGSSFGLNFGAAGINIAIPNVPPLVGLTLYFQALLSDPLANPAGLITSNGVEVFCGARTY